VSFQLIWCYPETLFGAWLYFEAYPEKRGGVFRISKLVRDASSEEDPKTET
jgi:hypothetical protein